ncbi:hypothetical protein [Synechococcus sp. PCC 7336]|uniref:hypothetical protein n=1 Tax=Synechococcus sp. PCC 7336 TaxID=195250 RepID=UPI000347E00D|nr:hypothetical protein [Synechococcus sp. PCC 7336]
MLTVNSEVLRAAQQVYNKHSARLQTLGDRSPSGVVVDINTLRGDLLFAEVPVLLPYEKFIPLHQLQVRAAS